jgi:hypothetical protein
MNPPRPPSNKPPQWTNPARKENRASPRFPSHVRTFCQSIKEEDELLWSVKVQEVSPQGLKIISHRRFEPGTVLRIGLIRDKAGLVMARAVHVSQTPEGDWAIGCTFPKKLEEAELRAWLEEDQ